MEFTLISNIEASPEQIYTAWLNSEGHANMTGGTANVSDKLGDKFEAWDGYIDGENLELEPHTRIVQSWRTSNFDDHEEDSQIEILLKRTKSGTELTLIHSNVPESGEHYINGWEHSYFTPMKAFFAELNK